MITQKVENFRGRGFVKKYQDILGTSMTETRRRRAGGSGCGHVACRFFGPSTGQWSPAISWNCVKEGNCFKFLEQQRHLIPYASYFTLKLTDHLRSWNAINNAAAHEVVRNVSV